MNSEIIRFSLEIEFYRVQQYNFSTQIMKKGADLLPLQFGSTLQIKNLTWDDFKGNVDENMPWSAHIYWYIDYEILDHQKRKIKVNLRLSHRSWVRE